MTARVSERVRFLGELSADSLLFYFTPLFLFLPFYSLWCNSDVPVSSSFSSLSLSIPCNTFPYLLSSFLRLSVISRLFSRRKCFFFFFLFTISSVAMKTGRLVDGQKEIDRQRVRERDSISAGMILLEIPSSQYHLKIKRHICHRVFEETKDPSSQCLKPFLLFLFLHYAFFMLLRFFFQILHYTHECQHTDHPHNTSLPSIHFNNLILVYIFKYVRGIHQNSDSACCGDCKENVKLETIDHHGNVFPVLPHLGIKTILAQHASRGMPTTEKLYSIIF